MNDDFGFIPEQQVSNNSVDDFGFIPEQTQKANSTKKVATPRPQVKYLPNGEIDTEDYKKNLDQYYDIPQTELPQRERIVNSDGVLQGGIGYVPTYEEINQSLKNNQITKEQALNLGQQRHDLDFKEADKIKRNEGIRNTIGGLIVGASTIPILNLPVTGALGGGLAGWGEGILQHKSAKDTAKDVGIGAATGFALGKLPVVGRFIGKTKIGKAVMNKAGEFTEQAIGKLSNTELGTKLLQGADKVGNFLTKERTLRPLPAQKITLQPLPQSKNINQPISLKELKNNIKSKQSNYFGGDEIPAVTGKTEVANTQLNQTMARKGTLPDDMREVLANNPPEYQVLHNADLQNQAAQTIRENPQDVYTNLVRKANTKEEEFSALDFEQARQTISRLYQEGKIDDAITLTEEIAKKGSKAGQAVQAMSLWSKTTPEGAQLFAQKVLDKYNKANNKNLKLTTEQAQKIRSLAENIQRATEGREQEVAIAQLMRNIADLTPKSWNKKYDTYRYMNMLLSGKSRIKDFFLTGLNSLDNAVDETIATGIDRVRTLLPRQERVFDGLKPKEYFQGLNKGFREGVEDVRLDINTSRSGETGRYGLPNTPSFDFKPVFHQNWESITNNPLWNAGNNLLASGEKALNYTIQVPDRMFYEARYASSLADQMATTGVIRPTSEMIKQAQKEALEAVYQDNSWVSKLGNVTRKGINDITGNFEQTLGLNENTLPRAGDFLMPFVTTPANIVNQGLKNTVGAIPGTIKLATAKTPQQIRDAEMLIAKNIKGLAPIGLGLGIGADKIKSNIGSEDYQSDSVTGLKPQSIVFGDKAISLKDYPQWSIPMSIAAGYSQGGLGQAALNAGQAISDISALKTLGDITGTVKGGFGQELKADEIVDNLVRTVGVNALTQNIPFSGALGELRNDIDPYARELYTPDTGEYVKNRVLNRLPYASKTLPQKYNAVGEPVYTNNIQNPVARMASEAFDFGIRNYNENPTYNTYEQFKKDIADTDITGKSTVGFKKAPRSIKINGEKVKLNNQQYSLYQRDSGLLNQEIKANLLNDNIFMNQSVEEQVKTLNDWRKAVDQAVLYKLFGNIPNKWNKNTEEVLNYYDNITP